MRAPRLHYASAFRFITFEVKGGNSTAAAGTTLLPATGTLAVLLMLALTPGQPTLRLQVPDQRPLHQSVDRHHWERHHLSHQHSALPLAAQQ